MLVLISHLDCKEVLCHEMQIMTWLLVYLCVCQNVSNKIFTKCSYKKKVY